jgi:hypothetical protein
VTGRLFHRRLERTPFGLQPFQPLHVGDRQLEVVGLGRDRRGEGKRRRQNGMNSHGHPLSSRFLLSERYGRQMTV